MKTQGARNPSMGQKGADSRGGGKWAGREKDTPTAAPPQKGKTEGGKVRKYSSPCWEGKRQLEPVSTPRQHMEGRQVSVFWG